MLDRSTYCAVWGMQLDMIQRMLDYDFICDRTPSVQVIIAPDSSINSQKLFFGGQQILIPVVRSLLDLQEWSQVTVLINLASARTASSVVESALSITQLTHVFTIAEGIPEQETRRLHTLNHSYEKQLFGPSIVGALLVGALRVGNTGGSFDNLFASRLHTAGSVGIISKSGGMLGELFRVVAHRTDGVHSAYQIGGDRYPLSSFATIAMQYQQAPGIEMIVMLGEVGNTQELELAELIRSGVITKPVVAWCAGTSADFFTQEIQFGHAGASANSEQESAHYKNQKLVEVGAYVPESYEQFGEMIQQVWSDLPSSQDKQIATNIPLSAQIIEKQHIIAHRRPTTITTTITDERGDELLYNGVPISSFVQTQQIARVIGHLWLKQELPDYAITFLNTALIVLADHGPAVSGAHNTIVTARAGKNLVDSVCAGLLTVGDRFGGAITGAASYFAQALAGQQSAFEFVKQMKAQGTLIPGIGHKIKSIHNPDVRCALLLQIAQSFPSQQHLVFAQQVEAITTSKKPNLILNVDGCIGAMLLDLLVSLGYSPKDIDQLIAADLGNGIFVLARTIGLIGHHIDQSRIDEGLYRMLWDDIFYAV